MKLPILYHQARTGKLHSWEISTTGNVISQVYGTVDGEKSATSKAVQGKNLGKINETTPQEQAELEAKSLWQKKKDTKYSETKTAAKETVFLPMLAQDLKKRFDQGKDTPFQFPVDIQPKLDGVRCMAFWENGKVMLMSRGGKEWIVPHVTEALQEVLPQNYVVDGELYVHGLLLQDIIHLIKNPDLEEHKQVEFNMFDGFFVPHENTPWNLRRFDLEKIAFTKVNFPLKIVHTKSIFSLEDLHKHHDQYIEEGYEGIMVRTLQGKYELGHRSRSLWKLKKFITEEFEIVGFKEADGNDKGTIVWVVKLPNNGTCDVRPKGTRAQRTDWFKNGNQYLGRMLTVKFQRNTKDGSLEFPAGVAIREPEDM